jgi:hypothetical protein
LGEFLRFRVDAVGERPDFTLNNRKNSPGEVAVIVYAGPPTGADVPARRPCDLVLVPQFRDLVS